MSPHMEGGEVVSNMEKAVTVSAQNTGFQCVHCGKILSEEARRKHVKHVQDKIREHICEIFAKAFFSSSDLNKQDLTLRRKTSLARSVVRVTQPSNI